MSISSVADGIMKLYSSTGLLHGYSYNWWSDLAIMDESFIEEWLDSPQTSLYYSLQVMGDVQDKSDAYAALKDVDVDDYLSEILNEPQCDCARIMATSLTREQKLLAEIVVQLGNITEAIQSAAAGEDSSDLNNKIDALQSQLGCCILCPCRSPVNNLLKRKPSMLNSNLNWLSYSRR